MGNGNNVTVMWEYFPTSQSDPVTGYEVVQDMERAVDKAVCLKTQYGERLRYVDMRVRIVGDDCLIPTGCFCLQ